MYYFTFLVWFVAKFFLPGFNNKREQVMKQAIAGVIVSGLSISSALAVTPYVSGSAGLAVLGNSELTVRSYDAGYNIVGAAGLDGGLYRLEAELGHQKNGIKNTDASESMTTFMGNGYIDLELPLFPLKPFVLAGVGVANVDDDNGVGDTVFAWQFGGGAGLSVAPLTTLDVQYRYYATSSAELAGRHNYSIGTHNVMLGLRFGF